ncbi:MFS transporter [Geodermatophilus sp. TF02-6]|uniref:MFS transporter n=1 Tax=Geodermatophilus sp. TF02-6 TaxID=2250575 RepID=UPI000DEA5349|nr:MFS transporter [Geodermatophilus sp. TF02-6]RBY82046.1 MFS transporter [Geodermatophilus sp. TF02-6]
MSTTSTAATSNKWLVLVAMTGSLSMVVLDQTVVTVALPSMSRELPLSATGEQWVVNAYVLALATLVAFGGRLGDLFGGVRIFQLGVLLFFLASAGCGLAPRGDLGEPWLIACRALQGAGAALMTPVSAVIVIAAFGVAERGRAMAVYAGIGQVFLAVGPLVGGILTQTVSWRAVFWLNVPVGLAALVVVHVARPENVRRSGSIAPGSVLLLIGGLGATVLAVQQASRWSWTSPITLAVLAAGLVLTAVFVRTQAVVPDPLVDVRLLRRRPFLGDVAVSGLVQFGLLAVVLYGSLYLQDLLRFRPVRTGLAVLALILPITVAAQIGGSWYDRSGVRPPVLTGLVFSVVGLLAWTAALPRLTYWLQVPGMVLTGLGLGLTISPTTTDSLGRVAPVERAQASGLLQTVRQLGGTLGVAVIGAVVLGLERAGTRSPSPHRAADAIAVGFAASAVAFAVAVLVGYGLLSRERVTQTGGGADDHRNLGPPQPSTGSAADRPPPGPAVG